MRICVPYQPTTGRAVPIFPDPAGPPLLPNRAPLRFIGATLSASAQNGPAIGVAASEDRFGDTFCRRLLGA
jgi:hypothetical protein